MSIIESKKRKQEVYWLFSDVYLSEFTNLKTDENRKKTTFVIISFSTI